MQKVEWSDSRNKNDYKYSKKKVLTQIKEATINQLQVGSTEIQHALRLPTTEQCAACKHVLVDFIGSKKLTFIYKHIYTHNPLPKTL